MLAAKNILETPAVNHRVVPAGREIYAEGEPCDSLFLVLDGWAMQHQILEDGRRQILNFALPGSLLGFQPNTKSEMTHTAECLSDVTVAVIPKSQMREIFERHPKFAFKFAVLAGETLNSAYETLTDVGRRTAREAVAHILLRLYQRVKAQQPSGPAAAVDFPLTLEHIGDALGLTGVHVCRTLRALREDGIAHLSRGTLRILDLEKLIEAAGCGEEEFNFEDRQDQRFGKYNATGANGGGGRKKTTANWSREHEGLRLAS